MYIVFEGIDGSGKTTLSTRLAEVLRAQGLDVFHTREAGNYASEVAQALREVGRDPQNLRLSHVAEMMLGMAREAQVMDESVKPALARGAHVITDRSVFSWMAMAVDGRGLDAAQVRGCAEAATTGVWPDLVIVADVDLRTSRRRKRLQKISDRRVGEVSRKGLSGLWLRQAQREGLLRMARNDADRWVVVDNARGSIEQSLAAILDAVGRRLGRPLPAPTLPPPRPAAPELAPAVLEARDPEALTAELFRLLEVWSERDPGFVAFLLADLDDPRIFALRERLADRHPALIAWALRGARSPQSIALRERLFAREPDYVVRSVTGFDDEWAWTLRRAAVETAPRGVAASLRDLAGERAFALRHELRKAARREVLGSLARLDHPDAWAMRERHGKKDPLGLGKSLHGLDDDRAWTLREAVLGDYPLGLVASVATLPGVRAMRVRERYAAWAPRLVLDSLRQVGTPEAYALRARYPHMGKELCDSVHGLDQEEAWAIRERNLDAWANTAVRSVGALLGKAPRGVEFVWRALAKFSADLHVIKVGQLVLTRPPADDGDGGGLEVDLPG